MPSTFRCGTPRRRAALEDQDGSSGRPILNGIDYLEVASEDQTVLKVYFFFPLPGTAGGVPPGSSALGAGNVLIEDGRECVVESVASSGKVLTVTVAQPGDFSLYRLRIVESAIKPVVLSGFDPEMSEVPFSFKAECPSDYDCKPVSICPPVSIPEPLIDYLAKDYASFRRLMLDRLSLIMPGWKESSPADAVIAVVEDLAHAADQLSYYQDVVATEAYLGTARSRISARRHARLLDYLMHDGCNARTWIQMAPDDASDGTTVPAGTPVVTRLGPEAPWLAPDDLGEAIRAGALVFETLSDLRLRKARNEILFYTWGDENCCLPAGSTHATLRFANPDHPGDDLSDLAAGDMLLFEETASPATGVLADADPTHRHVVRLTHVEFAEDCLFPESADHPESTRVVEVDWDRRDALPFPLCVSKAEPQHPGTSLTVSVARGNLVLADHGRTLGETVCDPVDDPGSYRPRIDAPVTQQSRVIGSNGELAAFDASAPASSALAWDMADVQPVLTLVFDDPLEVWGPKKDLLDSHEFSHDFVVEVEEDGSPALRFGDGMHGELPPPEVPARIRYRVGNGSVGNVSAEAIGRLVWNTPLSVKVRNPLPARGGTDPESIESVRLSAPQAFRVQERAVTEADYEEVTQRRPDIQRARATLRWTGSWYTSFVSVDPFGSETVDSARIADLERYLDRFRLAGCDIAVEGPKAVPLDIAFTVCVAAGYFRSDVRAALFDAFSNHDLADGRRGFFHPDNFTFGTPVYVSRIVATAMGVPGVEWVDLEVAAGKKNRFQRWGQLYRGEFLAGQIAMDRLEIARLDNDPSAPEHGRIDFFLEGGL